MSMTGYVYAIGMEGTTYVKIGRARSPARRLAALQTSLPFKLELLYTLEVDNSGAVERALHVMLAANRVRGEWFEMPDDPLPDLFDKARAAALPARETSAKDDLPSHVRVGALLRQERIEQGLTLKDLEALTGYPDSLLSLVERGKRPNVAFNTVARIAEALGLSELAF